MAEIEGAGKTNPIKVKLQLQPFESIIVQTYNLARTGKIFSYIAKAGATQEIKGNWTIAFSDGGPTIPSGITSDKLVSWTELGDENAKNFSGLARYSISIGKPSGSATSYLLDLGKVHETAEVFLNGKSIATLIGPSFQCIIPAAAFQQTNKLEVVVANLMANRIAYMDRNNIPWKIFYNTNMPARRREMQRMVYLTLQPGSPCHRGCPGRHINSFSNSHEAE